MSEVVSTTVGIPPTSVTTHSLFMPKTSPVSEGESERREPKPTAHEAGQREQGITKTDLMYLSAVRIA